MAEIRFIIQGGQRAFTLTTGSAAFPDHTRLHSNAFSGYAGHLGLLGRYTFSTVPTAGILDLILMSTTIFSVC